MADEATTGGAIGTAAPTPKPAPAPSPAAKPAAKSGGVGMRDQYGQELGFTVDVGGTAAEGEDLAGLAERIKGWSEFQLDGKPYEYSPENARALVSRFPHFAEQLRAG